MKYLLLFLIIFFIIKIEAQDIHFSQYFYSPLTLNPASAGAFNGDWRVVNNYRNQWKALSIPYRTIGISYEHQLYIYTENFSYGFNVINDKSGPAGLTVNKLFGTFSYHKKVENNTFHFGLQGGMVFKAFSLDELTFPSQFDMTTGYFNNQLSNNETNLNLHENYPDLNAGIIWNHKNRFGETELGLSTFHLIMPKESFLNENNHLPIRYILHGNILIPIKNMYLKPQIFQMRQHKATDLIFGSELGINLDNAPLKIKRIFGGLFIRNNLSSTSDASIGMIGIQIQQWQFAFSYDINTSPLQVATQKRGAIEFSLIFTSKSTIPNKYAIPCDRM